MKNSKITKKLIDEQDAIINSDCKRAIILAGPGSGKTYTIIKKVKKRLNELDQKKISKGIIICSFTREASLELRKRLSPDIQNNLSFVGTLDSFILKKLVNPFKNRIIQKLKPGSQIIKGKLKTFFPSRDAKQEVNILTKEGITEQNKKKILNYYKNWFKDLISGIYEVSFSSYLLLEIIIDNLKVIKNYIQITFDSIYIDEAQDLNAFQIRFIKKIIKNININCFLIGDIRQSIYSFRGSKPELLQTMKKYDFSEFWITNSARCHFDILEFSNAIINNKSNLNMIRNNKRVNINFLITDNINFLNEINNYFILVEKNEDAHRIHKKCLEQGISNIIYSKKISLKNKEFEDNYYDVIEELLKFYFNHNNTTPSLSYSIEDLIVHLEILSNYNKINKSNLLIKNNESFCEYLTRIFLLVDIDLPEKILQVIEEQISQNIYKDQYIRYKNINRIMTIHSSKGLEAKYVFLYLIRNDFKISREMKRKLFVAFTRAKDYLYIGFKGKNHSKLESYINSIFNSIFKID